jgi:hypothetical protein
MNNPNGLPNHAGTARCPYVGLHDDPGTSLAYCSAWNYCYRARPPASVLISHQGKTCLTPEYICCPVYLSPEQGSLPASLRGGTRVGHRRRGSVKRIITLFLLVLLMVIVVLIMVLGRGLPFR